MNNVNENKLISSIFLQHDYVEQFLFVEDLVELISAWQKINKRTFSNKTEYLRTINTDIAHIDYFISKQLNEIIHHSNFQQLEALWLNLSYLIDIKEKESDYVKIRILDAKWQDVCKDMSKSMEFDQTALFKKVYSEEFDSPGGQPFGIMLGDYDINIQGSGSIADLDALRSISQVMAASFCPFVANVTLESFGLDTLDVPLSFSSIDQIFKQPQFSRWQDLRKNAESKFVGLTLPRLILRNIYKHENKSWGDFCFQEEVCSGSASNRLWGRTSLAFGSVVMNSFARNGWPTEIRGDKNANNHNGEVEYLPELKQSREELVVEMVIDPIHESAFADMGFIPLCQTIAVDKPIFYDNVSIYCPDDNNVNEKVSSMLQYVLCASRFAHYLKVIGRDKVGSNVSPGRIQNILDRWVRQYVAVNDVPLSASKRFPLAGAKVELANKPDNPGSYYCTFYLKPRIKLEKVNTYMKLITELNEIRS